MLAFSSYRIYLIGMGLEPYRRKELLTGAAIVGLLLSPFAITGAAALINGVQKVEPSGHEFNINVSRGIPLLHCLNPSMLVVQLPNGSHEFVPTQQCLEHPQSG